MKIYLIKASSGSDYSKYKAMTGGPSQNIFSAAAATPSRYKLEMTDETIGMATNFESDAELIVIFMSTPDAYRAYEIANTFRQKGKKAILGGLHTKFNQKEAAENANALILGEVENYWEQMLVDAEKGELRDVYESSEPVDLTRLNPYPTDIIPPKQYSYVWSVVVTRGCPFKCDFCLVHKFFNQFQLRPIDHIVDELKHLKKIGVKWAELHSDNLTHNKEYAMQLFEAIAPIGLKFYGETTVLIARDEALLKAAQKAGFKAVLLGIETPSTEALKSQKKAFVKPEKLKEHIATIKKYGIEVWGDFLFGFDEHTPEIFETTVKFIKDIKVDKSIAHHVIPFPGSETFEKQDSEGRIITKDWSKYDGSHTVFQPKSMTAKELDEGVYWVWKETASFLERAQYWFYRA